LKEYSEDMIRLNRNGVRGTVRPSGHVIRDSFDKIHAGGAIPSNVTEAPLSEVPESLFGMGNNAANDSYTKQCKDNGIKILPARFPTGAVAESPNRRWIAGEAVEEYLKASTFRFEDPENSLPPDKSACSSPF
jgi:hypothetical protein